MATVTNREESRAKCLENKNVNKNNHTIHAIQIKKKKLTNEKKMSDHYFESVKCGLKDKNNIHQVCF